MDCSDQMRQPRDSSSYDGTRGFSSVRRWFLSTFFYDGGSGSSDALLSVSPKRMIDLRSYRRVRVVRSRSNLNELGKLVANSMHALCDYTTVNVLQRLFLAPTHTQINS